MFGPPCLWKIFKDIGALEVEHELTGSALGIGSTPEVPIIACGYFSFPNPGYTLGKHILVCTPAPNCYKDISPLPVKL